MKRSSLRMFASAIVTRSAINQQTRKQYRMVPFDKSERENGHHSIVITGARAYNGCTGHIVGCTTLLPPWYVVDLDDGRRVVVRPGYLRQVIPTAAMREYDGLLRENLEAEKQE